MKNKIYSKLFQYVDPKSWVKNSIGTNGDYSYTSDFYPEYKLEFYSTGIVWIYKLYPKESVSYGSYTRYSSHTCHTGFVTLNVGGKILFSIILSVILFFVKGLLLAGLPLLIYISLILGFSYILTYFLYSVFNWKIYMSFRKAQYSITNAKKIIEKEELEKLNNDIVKIVNNTLSKNPKMARKTKLEKIKKFF